MAENTSQRYVHPITDVIRTAVEVFTPLGFTVAQGPEIETEYYNFDALNVPKDHPAKDMQDTFWMPSGTDVLRTHTSNVQTRWMESHKPPIRIIVPGKCYRNEATDMTHEAEFYQLEGLVVDEHVSLGNMSSVLEQFFGKLFGGAVEVRFRPSFFPFTEPSVEVDMRLSGNHVPEKLRDKWIEIMGAGMVHPNVLNNVGIDARRYKGFAFGGGLERLAMLKWSIDDIRHFESGDLRFLTQFKSA
jgi:phenylalanyl-tRNA synthetase alpha chain